MLIIDAHLDLAWNALHWSRDLQQPAALIRAGEAGMAGPGRGLGTVSLPDLRRGQVGLCFATLLARCTGAPVAGVDYASPAQACGAARGQLAYYRALEHLGAARIIAGVAALESHVAAWQRWLDGASAEEPPLGFVVSMESADPILSPADLEDWQRAGVRVIGPAHYGPGRYAGGTGSDLGVTGAGAALLREMRRLGILLDVTHFSDRAFWQALELYDGLVLASHNNCRALAPHPRQFSNEQIRAIAGRGGVIGAACDAWMLAPGWVKGVTRNDGVRLSAVADHIDCVCQLTGSARHAAIGSDLDGGFGREQSPGDLDTIADLQGLAGLLAARGYGPGDVAAILHGNWLRLLRSAWAAG